MGEALVGADGGDGGGGVAVGEDAIDEAQIGAGAQLLEQIVGVARGDQAQVAAAQQVAVEVAREIRIVRGDDRLHQATISQRLVGDRVRLPLGGVEVPPLGRQPNEAVSRHDVFEELAMSTRWCALAPA